MPLPPRRVQVLIVDDDGALRFIVRRVLKRYPDISVVGEAESGEEACWCMEQLEPSVILMDINMPTMDGIEATRRIKQMNSRVGIVGFTLIEDDTKLAAMKEAGARLIVKKDRLYEDLYEALITSVPPTM
jgi:DNA-binding NarL/FixJ family response regulator